MTVFRYTLPVLLVLASYLPVEALPAGSAQQAASGAGVSLPAGYRDWRMISIARETGSLDDIRVVLGNDLAIKAFRTGTRPFPEGAQIARLAYRYVPSAQNDAAFGQQQSFVAGDPTNVQILVKNSKRFSGTGGWGFGQFIAGKYDPRQAPMQSCFACHEKRGAADDFVFTRYAP